MSIKNKTEEGLALCNIIMAGMEEKKAHDIVVMDLRELEGASAEYFVICHGTSDTQVEAIAHSVEAEVKKVASENAWHKEGYTNNEWVLLDYVNVVVHVFVEEQRSFFGLEDLWGDAKITRH